MADFYSEDNKRDHFSAPQFTRSRHRYRGERESEKINLEINQFYYSAAKLYERFDDIASTVKTNSDILFEGGDVDGVENEDGQLTLVGLEEIASEIEAMQKRLETLEG